MKTSEEFLAQIYEKYEREKTQRARRRKRLHTTMAVVAACLLLMIGVAGSQGWIALPGDFTGEDVLNATENAAPTDAWNENPDRDQAALPGADEDEDVDGAGDIDALPNDGKSPEAQEGGDSISGYYLLPRVWITEATSDEGGEGGTADQVIPGVEGLEAVEELLVRLDDAGRVTRAESKQKNWQQTYDYQVQVEREPQQFEFYYITGEVDWNEVWK